MARMSASVYSPFTSVGATQRSFLADYLTVCLDDEEHSEQNLTPVARLIFETKNRAIFLQRFFGRGISGAALLPYNFVPITWLWSGFIFPELEHL